MTAAKNDDEYEYEYYYEYYYDDEDDSQAAPQRFNNNAVKPPRSKLVKTIDDYDLVPLVNKVTSYY